MAQKVCLGVKIVLNKNHLGDKGIPRWNTDWDLKKI